MHSGKKRSIDSALPATSSVGRMPCDARWYQVLIQDHEQGIVPRFAQHGIEILIHQVAGKVGNVRADLVTNRRTGQERLERQSVAGRAHVGDINHMESSLTAVLLALTDHGDVRWVVSKSVLIRYSCGPSRVWTCT